VKLKGGVVILAKKANEYKWTYQHKSGIHKLATTTNEVRWIGYGTYTCVADNKAYSKTFASKGSTSKKHKIIAPPLKSWDMSKIPLTEIENIKELLEKKNLGKLIVLHNTYELSKTRYCCGVDTSPVIANFTKFINDL